MKVLDYVYIVEVPKNKSNNYRLKDLCLRKIHDTKLELIEGYNKLSNNDK